MRLEGVLIFYFVSLFCWSRGLGIGPRLIISLMDHQLELIGMRYQNRPTRKHVLYAEPKRKWEPWPSLYALLKKRNKHVHVHVSMHSLQLKKTKDNNWDRLAAIPKKKKSSQEYNDRVHWAHKTNMTQFLGQPSICLQTCKLGLGLNYHYTFYPNYQKPYIASKLSFFFFCHFSSIIYFQQKNLMKLTTYNLYKYCFNFYFIYNRCLSIILPN